MEEAHRRESRNVHILELERGFFFDLEQHELSIMCKSFFCQRSCIDAATSD
jgi:hypothetical protein